MWKVIGRFILSSLSLTEKRTLNNFKMKIYDFSRRAESAGRIDNRTK